MTRPVPVIMYHTVGVVQPAWRWHFLTVPWQVFESQLRFLSKAGYRSISLHELYAHQAEGKPLPANCLAFTFDDGYLDNWVYAAPLLKKYGFRGTIFVNPEFVDPSATPRPSLEDVWQGRCSTEELPGLGFLSWAEMRALEASGVMEIQSHAMSHTWYPAGPEIVDFRHPGDDYVWMDWNAAPQRKWAYLSAEPAPVRYGEPVYKHRKSLAGPRFFPDPGLGEHLVTYAARQGGDFFSRPNWREALAGAAQAYRAAREPAERYETAEQYLARLHWELGEAQRLIARNLDKEVPFLCWPGGGYGPEAVQIAKNYYRGSTLASRDAAPPGLDPGGHLRIRRIGVPCLETAAGATYPGGRYLFHTLREFQGSRVHRAIRQGLKLGLIWRRAGG